jgi:hypothetical protein
MFSVVVHFSGRFLAPGAVPSPFGPRQLGQLAAAARGKPPVNNATATTSGNLEANLMGSGE